MNSIETFFLGVQPLKINHNIYIKILEQKVPFDKIRKYSKIKKQKYNSLEWLEQYNILYDSYHELKILPFEDMGTDKLKEDLMSENYFAYNKNGDVFMLYPFLDEDKTKFALFYDMRFSYFILVYELHFSIPIKKLEDFLDEQEEDNDTFYRKDLYNTIRNIIVKETKHSHLGHWGTFIQESVIKQANSFVLEIFKIKLSNNEISIPPSSCNITCFFMDKSNNEKILIPKLEFLNNLSERLQAFTPIKSFYNNNVYYGFYGRFHTIYLKKEQDKFRFQPLQFHIQYMWFLLEQYNHSMNEINLKIMQNDSMKNLQKYAQIIHLMINKIELLSLHDNNFKHTIEIDYQTIYKQNEIRWSLPTLLSSSQRYINFFKDYLDRIFRQKNDISQKKQNHILLSISILQLVALISVWNDYLSLNNEKTISVSEKILKYFGSTEDLLNFNFYIPAFIFVIIIFIFIYLFIRQK